MTACLRYHMDNLFYLFSRIKINDAIIYQYNKTAMIPEENGTLSGKNRTKKINTHFYFITNKVVKGNLWLDNCPTQDMTAFFYKITVYHVA